jgi:hypothetical protein
MAQEFVDVETAKATSRSGFARMLDYANRHSIGIARREQRLFRCELA